jgi:hypothetical protein
MQGLLFHWKKLVPLLPIHTRPGMEVLGEGTWLEVEYELALIGYMLEVARGL